MRVIIFNKLLEFWRFWSVRFDLIMFSIMGYFIANPDKVPELVKLLPESLHPIAAVLVPAMLFAARSQTGAVSRKKAVAEAAEQSQ